MNTCTTPPKSIPVPPGSLRISPTQIKRILINANKVNSAGTILTSFNGCSQKFHCQNCAEENVQGRGEEIQDSDFADTREPTRSIFLFFWFRLSQHAWRRLKTRTATIRMVKRSKTVIPTSFHTFMPSLGLMPGLKETIIWCFQLQRAFRIAYKMFNNNNNCHKRIFIMTNSRNRILIAESNKGGWGLD